MRPKRIRFPRSKTIAAGFMTDLQVDLADMQALSRHNKGNRYILVGIDVLSKRLFTVPLKTKKGEEMVKAFQDLINKMPMKPHRIFSDKGTEFKNNQLKEFFAKEDIQKLEANHSTVKASIAERSIRNIKQRLYRYFAQKRTLKWIDVLEKIVDGINHSISRVHGLRPIDVNFKNAQNVWKKIYGNIFSKIKNVKSKFNKGDYVRLSSEKGNFEKGYLPNWGDEIVQVDGLKDTLNPITYKIKDDKGNKFKGSFYKEEIAKVRRDDDTEYRIEKILRKRTRDDGANELLVKFIGYPETQWIHESQLSPPKASPPISPPRLDRKRKRDLQTPPRIDDLPESQPKINTILKTPPKISPPKVNKPSSIEKDNAITIKEKVNVREKDKTAEKKIPENEPLNDRQKKSGVAGQTQESNNQTSVSQIKINEEDNRQRIKSLHVIPPAITPLFALGLPNTENTNNKTLVKDNDNEITIEEDKEGNTDNVDTNKFSLWRGGIRLSGNLTLLKNMINSITFEYNIDFGRFFLKINHSNIDYISLSTQLCYVLGFENPQIIKNKDVAKYGSDLKGGFSSFGVYVKGLTEKMIIGDSLSSLLRVVSISGATPGEYNEKIYDTPIYSRVLPKEINDIEVELRTLDNGRLVPFSYGTVLIVLIFKKVINF
uniref:Integrase catalytic domain-containing protein n=1 Tax=Meloidogyne incognita TaxID=6306 RepID=A0A914MV96_MELIC